MLNSKAQTRSLESKAKADKPDPPSAVTGKVNLIGHRVRHHIPHASIRAISGGEFDERFLADYPHGGMLEHFVEETLNDHGDDVYLGPETHARLMGCVMQRMRSGFGANTPAGWLPVMKRLRAMPLEDFAWCSPNGEGYAEPGAVTDPEDILTANGHSSIHAIDPELAERLGNMPAIRARFVEAAKREGVPEGWRDALPFVERRLAEISDRPSELVALRDKLAERV